MANKRALKDKGDKFFDSEKLYNNLALSGLYLATFEILKSSIIHNTREFFSGFDKTATSKEMPAKYKGEAENYLKILQSKDKDIFLPCCQWLKKMGAITQEEI